MPDEKPQSFESINKTDLAAALVRIYEDEKSDRVELENNWMDCLYAYHGELISHLTTENKHSLPGAQEVIEESSAGYLRACIPTNEDFTDIKCSEEYKPLTDIVLRFIHSKIRQDCYRQLDQGFKVATWSNVAAIWFEWLHKEVPTQFMDPTTKEIKKRYVTKYDGIKPKVISNWDWLVTSRDEIGEGLFFRVYKTSKRELEALEKEGHVNLSEVEWDSVSRSTSGDETDEPHSQKNESAALGGVDRSATAPDRDIEIIEVWGDVPIEDVDGEYRYIENARISILNRNTVISIGHSPLFDGSWPVSFLQIVASPDPIQPYGTSLLSNAIPLLKAAITWFNNTLELADKQVKNPLQANPRDTALRKQIAENGNKLVTSAGSFIWTLNGVKPLETSTYIASMGFQVVGEIIQRFQEATKTVRSFSHQSFEKTATEVAGILEQFNNWMAKTVQYIQKTFIVDFVSKYWLIWLQYRAFVSPEAAIKEIEDQLNISIAEELRKQGSALNPLEMFQQWEFVPTGTSHFALRQARLNDIRMLLAIAASIPGGAERIKIAELLQLVAREMELNIGENLLVSDEEWKELMDMKRQELEQAKAEAREMMDLQHQYKLEEKFPASAMLDNLLQQRGNQDGQNQRPGQQQENTGGVQNSPVVDVNNPAGIGSAISS